MYTVYKTEGYLYVIHSHRIMHGFAHSHVILHYLRCRALYKGLVPKVLRLGPGGAIMLVVYDYAHAYLTRKFKE